MRTTVALTTDNNSVSVDKEEWGVSDKRNPIIKVIIASRLGRTRKIYFRRGEARRLAEELFKASTD